MVIYIIFRCLLLFLRFIPFRVLYIFSDIIACFIYHIVRYRKAVVFDNLQKSFPDKSSKELQTIAKKFYRHFTDISLESIKGFTVSEPNMRQRYRYTNRELSDLYFKQGKNIIIAAGHYGNWEWGTQAMSEQMLHFPIGIYKPLTNKHIDAFIRRHRAKHKVELVPIAETRFAFVKTYPKPFAMVMIGDQNPSNSRKAYWTRFLNQDTACLHGIENYAKTANLPILYFAVTKLRRGYYEISGELLVEDANQYGEGEITAMFMKKLEKQIIEKPEYWLWSHRRWKHTAKPETKIIVIKD